MSVSSVDFCVEKQEDKEESTLLMEPNKNIPEKYSLPVAQSIVDLDKRVIQKVQTMNLFPENKVFLQKPIICTIELVECVAMIEQKDSTTNSQPVRNNVTTAIAGYKMKAIVITACAQATVLSIIIIAGIISPLTLLVATLILSVTLSWRSIGYDTKHIA